MNILITNDDGIRADGIIELAKELAKTHNIYVVAPDTQRSATGHAITIHNPIMVNKEYIDDNISAYSISGTPADCVKIGVEALFKEVNIDMVLIHLKVLSLLYCKQWRLHLLHGYFWQTASYGGLLQSF